MELFIFYNVLQHSTIQALLAGENVHTMRELITFSETEGITDLPLTELIVSLLANDENILSGLVQANRKVGKDLYEFALKDLRKIFTLFEKGAEFVYHNSKNASSFAQGYCTSIHNMTNAKTPEELLELLIAHYRLLGVGVFAKYIAFGFDGRVHGIAQIDREIVLDSLIGLVHQKKVLVENTEALLAGKQANNVLLFGDRGTGKSSCVKALLNLYASRGLRVIEVQKQQIHALAQLFSQLAAKPNQYIIFLDDLSFEKQDADYKALKTLMDGQLQAMPKNVVIYATSNRKHLVKESWSDRQPDDVHANDNMQETLSLAERFGISLVFSLPNQKEYLQIVGELLARNGIEMTAEIEKQAMVWQMNYGSKSPRCATQFVYAYCQNRT